MNVDSAWPIFLEKRMRVFAHLRIDPTHDGGERDAVWVMLRLHEHEIESTACRWPPSIAPGG